MVARAGLREAAPVAEMAALKIGWPACVLCSERDTGTHAEGEPLYLWEERPGPVWIS